MRSSDDSSRRSKSRVASCLGCCIGLPLLLAVIGYMVYRHNNQPPDLIVPTHDMPDDNARDIFLNAEKLAQGMKHKSPYDLPNVQSRTYANFAACATDAAPALKAMREGLNHPYMNPPERSAAQSATMALTHS
jgi:hypothetical protein